TASATRLSGLSGCRGFAVGCGGDEGEGKGAGGGDRQRYQAFRAFRLSGFRGWLRRGRRGGKGAGGEDRQRYQGFRLSGFSRLVAAGTKWRGKAPAAETASATRLSGCRGFRGWLRRGRSGEERRRRRRPPALPGCTVVGVFAVGCGGDEVEGKGAGGEDRQRYQAFRLSGFSRLVAAGTKWRGKAPAAKTASATRLSGCRGFRGWLRRGRSGGERRRRRRPPALPGFPVVGVFAVGCGGDEVEGKGAGGEDRQRYQAFRLSGFSRLVAAGTKW